MMSIGHNGPPPDYKLTPANKIERILTLLDREGLTSAQKCVGVKIIAEADRDGFANIRTPELMRASSSRDRETVFRATKALGDAGIEKSSDRGQAGRYVVLPERVMTAVVQAYENTKSSRRDADHFSNEQSASSGRDDKTKPVGLDSTGRVEPVGFMPTGRVHADQSGRPSRADNYNNKPTTEPVDRFERITSVEQVDRKNIRAVEFELKPEPTNPRALGTSPRQSKATSETDISFEKFWSLFPAERRRGKGKARGLFASIVAGRHKVGRTTSDEIVQAVREGRGIDPSFPPMPETWLNQGRWMDEPAGAVLVGPNGKKWGWWRGLEPKLKSLSLDHWRKAIQETKPNGTWPWWIFGAPPGDPECLVPEEIVAEYGYEEIYRGKITHG